MILINSPQRRGVHREKNVFFSFASERPADENPRTAARKDFIN